MIPPAYTAAQFSNSLPQGLKLLCAPLGLLSRLILSWNLTGLYTGPSPSQVTSVSIRATGEGHSYKSRQIPVCPAFPEQVSNFPSDTSSLTVSTSSKIKTSKNKLNIFHPKLGPLACKGMMAPSSIHLSKEMHCHCPFSPLIQHLKQFYYIRLLSTSDLFFFFFLLSLKHPGLSNHLLSSGCLQFSPNWTILAPFSIC